MLAALKHEHRTRESNQRQRGRSGSSEVASEPHGAIEVAWDGETGGISHSRGQKRDEIKAAKRGNRERPGTELIRLKDQRRDKGAGEDSRRRSQSPRLSLLATVQGLQLLSNSKGRSPKRRVQDNRGVGRGLRLGCTRRVWPQP